jgi:hypothetical protein
MCDPYNMYHKVILKFTKLTEKIAPLFKHVNKHSISQLAKKYYARARLNYKKTNELIIKIKDITRQYSKDCKSELIYRSRQFVKHISYNIIHISRRAKKHYNQIYQLVNKCLNNWILSTNT